MFYLLFGFVLTRFAKTTKQARQFITHGHLMINGQKTNSPGYLVKKEEENKIQWIKKPLELEPKKQIKKIEEKSNLKKEFEATKPQEKTEKGKGE